MKSSVFFCVVVLIFVTPLFSQTDWTRHTGNPVLPVGDPGSWDDEGVLHPSVYFDGTTYHMWYSGSDGINIRIGYATSPDGIVWTKHPSNPVVDVGPPGSWDWQRVYFSTVVIINSTYHMWYTGDDASNERIGHATSPDGINWTKDTLNPVINLGPPGSWYDVHVGTGFVMTEGDTLHLWFWGFDGTYFRIGHAKFGGTTWIYNPDNPVLDVGSWDNPRVQFPCVVYNTFRSEYYMLYAGGGLFNWEIGYASSQNINGPWTKPTNESIFKKGGAGTWESAFVTTPFVIFDSDNIIYKMWYNGGDASLSSSIGYATSPINLPDTLRVPGDYSTIQAAIDAANHSDIVLVDEDTYYENINFKGKAITVASHFLIDGDETHIENTIIDGSQPSNLDSGSVVYFTSGEDTTSVLCGFTITGGTGTLYNVPPVIGRAGGGIAVFGSGASIKNNIIEYNDIEHSTDAWGGGIFARAEDGRNFNIVNNLVRNNSINTPYVDYNCLGGGIYTYSSGNVLIANNKVIENSITAPEAFGGGISPYGGGNCSVISNFVSGNILNATSGGSGGIDIYYRLILRNNLIVNNSAPNGGGMWIEFSNAKASLTGGRGIITELLENSNNSQSFLAIDAFLENNTIVNNTATVAGGGIQVFGGSVPELMNFIIWGNTAPNDPQISGTVTVTYSDVEGGYTGMGNIDLNPEFLDTTYFILSNISPCIDTGNPDPMYNDVEDPLNPGNPLWPALGTLTNDMGHCGGPNSLWAHLDPPVSVEDDEIEGGIPAEFTLSQNYPNPFNPTTTIVYGLRERTNVELKLFDVLGREVETIFDGEQNAGFYEVEFNASRLASGIYFYRLRAGSFVETKKMLLLK